MAQPQMTHSRLAVIALLITIVWINVLNGDVVCPDRVTSICVCQSPLLSVRCSEKNLNEYPDFDTIKHIIRQLDVSFNQLKTFPANLDHFDLLETLDLSHNQIESISNKIKFPVNLRHLLLSHNNITNWLQINPNTVLQSAINLHTLNLAGNPLRSFSSNDERLLLISNSLRTLDLSECQIPKIMGSSVLSGLINLEHLIFNGNPIHGLPDLRADKLLSLEMSACNLTTLHKAIFSQMPMLTYVNLSQNYRLSLLRRDDEFVESQSLRRIDLSRCNMNFIELNGFPNITTVVLRGNLVNQLTPESFENNKLIENLDLSYNAINRISVMTFRTLKRLRNLDLSFNMIRLIESDTFKDNQQLTSINLSRNYIERFRRFSSNTLTYLNMSRCEILAIDWDAMEDLRELIELDLSNNLFSEIPAHMGSSLLQIWDLSRCRLSTIRNDTFAGFPELSRLNLAGNRFTTIFRTDFFANNLYLNEIWLGDNPWRCECIGEGMHDFFRYLIVPPPRIKDRTQLRCNSPANADGKLWEVACYSDWYPHERKMGLIEKVWTVTMVILINLTIVYCAVMGLKRWLQHRKVMENEQERQQNMETTREIMRHNLMVLQQESQLNAPDPRETHPPCYEDAILLPRLDTSFASLKRAGLIGDDYDDIFKRATKRSRCQSEEVLCARDLNANKDRRHILAARIRRNQQANNTSLDIPAMPFTKTESQAEQQHTQRNVSTNSNQFECESDSFASNDFIFEPLQRFDSVDGSPYAKRKGKSSFELVVPVASTSAALLNQRDAVDEPGEIIIIENHYTSKSSLNYGGEQSSADASMAATQSKENISEISSACSSLASGDYSSFSNDEFRIVKRTDI